MSDGKGIKYFSIGFSVVCALVFIWVGYAMEMLGEMIVGGLVIVGFGFLIWNYMEKQYKLPDKLEGKGVLLHENNAIHKDGLPGVGNEKCTLCIRKSDFLIVSGNTEFSLEYSKIYNAVCTQDYKVIQEMNTTIKNKGSMGKALVGGALFGLPGAVIGAAGGTRSVSNTKVTNKEIADKKYLAITYQDNDEYKTITFEGSQFCAFELIEQSINKNVREINNLAADGNEVKL